MDPKHRNLIHGRTRDEVDALCRELHAPAYRAGQIWRWLHVQRVTSWEQMKTVPAPLRSRLAETLSLEPVRVVLCAGDAHGTRKLLLALQDEERIETVLIPAGRRRTVCVSSQVGCRYHCAFCASGQAGFLRNLEPGEITGQILEAARQWGSKPTHVVFMGVGEPLDNYEAVLKAVRIANDPEGLGIGARHITISTCGLVPGIERLARERIQVELSVSLHAPEDDLRSELMPVNRKDGISPLLGACSAYTAATGRIVTFEYALIRGVNDSHGQARRLARLLAPLPCRVNLIPLSPVPEYGGKPGGAEQAAGFIRILDAAGVNATLRASRGCALNAACGQLRASCGRT
jgi:23S rRNA (adenine2503-C2)-methyltransferase